jgi:hypothetical protein
MASKVTLPDPVAMGNTLANVDDFRAIMIVLVFVIVALMGFIIWRELNLASAIRTLNKMSEAMYALRLTLIEDRILAREEAARRHREREIDREERGALDKGSAP